MFKLGATMNCCGRKRIKRNIDTDHTGISFKPRGIPSGQLQSVVLYDDEIEAIRLADLASLYQQECADKMGISRTTFSRLIESARKKIADALLNKKLLHVKQRDTK